MKNIIKYSITHFSKYKGKKKKKHFIPPTHGMGMTPKDKSIMVQRYFTLLKE